MKIAWSKVRHALALGWFYARNHFTKALGIIAIIIGYGLENQAQFVALLSETRRGAIIKAFGFAAVLLGIYNRLWPPKPPPTPPPGPLGDTP